MFSSILNPCEVKVNLIQNVVFLRPSQQPQLDRDHRANELPPLANDELVRGIVQVYVPSHRQVDGIRVTMRGTQSIAILDSTFNYSPNSFENTTFMEKVVEIGVPRALSKQNPGYQSRSVSRARSPAPGYGGGGAHNDNIFRNMVRSVSRGRPSRLLEDATHSRRNSRLLDISGSPVMSRNLSPVRSRSPSVPHSRAESSSRAPSITSDDLQALSSALENVHVDERRGRSSRAHSIDQSRGRLLTRDSSPDDDEPRGRSSTVHTRPEVISVDEEQGLDLTKGVHAFEFAFILPADSPPYERNTFGKIRYSIKATVLGGGRARSNVDEWRDFFPMVNPAPDGGPTPMTVLYNDIHPTMGLVSVACTSNNISVGGLFNIDIHSPAPPADLAVFLVRISLHTTIELHTRKKGKQVAPVQKRRLFEKGWVPSPDKLSQDLHKLNGIVRAPGSDSAWTVQGIARIPDDNAIRPSTMSGTESSIRFSHVVVVEIVHSCNSTNPEASPSDSAAKLKVFTLRQAVIIPSCCCALDAVTLPPYSEKPADTVPHLNHTPDEANWNTILAANQDSGESHNMCVCGMSLADLSAAEQALLPPADPTDLLMDRVRRYSKVGELPEDMQQVAGPSALPSNVTQSPRMLQSVSPRTFSVPPSAPQSIPPSAVPSAMPSPSIVPMSDSTFLSPVVLPEANELPPAYEL
ncbi:hypothetical protein MCUN1_002872 [Malassezia cuniculi]|uniref:Arrestin-like N-terminal domain-containing protein n=1 Tax=Malassezia cuniculi TaxID=948313 RepID=A0AAF0JCK3_9BASI|nr:hypothetical protein MCUN1_002872 [Malassezia cuniculi]